MPIPNLDGFRTIANRAKTAQMQLSSREITPYSKLFVEKEGKTIVYDMFHPNNQVTQILEDGITIKNTDAIKGIIRKAVLICAENGILPHSLLGGMKKEEVAMLLKSMH